MNSHKLQAQLKRLSDIHPNHKWQKETSALLQRLPSDGVTEAGSSKYVNVSNLHFIFELMWKNRLLFSLGFLLLVTGAVGVFLLTQFKTQTQQFEYLTGAERDQVFEQIVKNNPIIIAAVDGAEGLADSFNYSYSYITWENGPKFGQCEIVGSAPGTYFGYKDSASYEEWRLVKDEFHSINKFVIKDASGKIQSIFYTDLLNPKRQTEYKYEGGDYAVIRVTNEHPFQTEETGEFPPDPILGEDGVLNSVTEASKFIELFYRQTPTVLKDKQGNVMLEYSYSVNCDAAGGGRLVGNGSDRATNKFVTRDYLARDTYRIIKTESFLEQVDSQNLVRTTNYEYEIKTATFADVKNEFALPANIKIKDIKPVDNATPGYELPSKAEQTNKIMNIIKTNNIPVLLVGQEGYRNIIWQGSGSTPYADDFYNVMDRKFYSDDARGEDLFQDMLRFSEQGPASLIHISSAPKVMQSPNLVDMIELDFYKAGYEVPVFGDPEYQKLVNKWDVVKQIGGKEVTFTIIKYEADTENPASPNYQGGVVEGSEIYNCVADTCKLGIFYIEIKFEGGSYGSNNPIYSEKALNKYLNLDLKLLDVNNAEEYKQIKTIVEDSYMIGG